MKLRIVLEIEIAPTMVEALLIRPAIDRLLSRSAKIAVLDIREVA